MEGQAVKYAVPTMMTYLHWAVLGSWRKDTKCIRGKGDVVWALTGSYFSHFLWSRWGIYTLSLVWYVQYFLGPGLLDIMLTPMWSGESLLLLGCHVLVLAG